MNSSKAAVIEFLLFASPKPLTILQLKEIIGDIGIDEIWNHLNWLKENFYHTGRALQICEVAGGFQICTREEFHPWLKCISSHQAKRRLSPSTIEVLAIVAYRQPITRNEIEDIRGVDSGTQLRNLLKQKLIKIAGRKDTPGRPIIYGITKEFLIYFGLNDLKDLPKESELREVISNENQE